MTDIELIEFSRRVMNEIHLFNQGGISEHEQEAYNAIRLLCIRLEAYMREEKTQTAMLKEIHSELLNLAK